MVQFPMDSAAFDPGSARLPAGAGDAVAQTEEARTAPNAAKELNRARTMVAPDPRRTRVLFTVTSALNVSATHSRFSNAQRLDQTRATVASIRASFPQADILVVDGSLQQPDAASVAQLGNGVAFVSYGHLPELQRIASHPNSNVVKNISELTLYSRLIGDLLSGSTLDQYQRVFKLSGRYQLNARFDASLHLSARAAERFVFARRTAATYDIAHVGTTYAWQTRLFSYDPALAHLLGSLYLVALREMYRKVARGIYTDIEHSIGRYLNANLVLEVDAIGVSGDLGTYCLHVEE
jgi:hypothetical protein